MVWGVILTSGCGYKGGTAKNGGVPAKNYSSPEKIQPAAKVSDKSYELSNDPAVIAYETEKKKTVEVTAALEDVSRMIKNSNLEGALRKVQQIQTQNARDPYITMQTNYLQAMIFHRQKDAPKRKEAMNQMLKNMETLQKDPRFKAAYEDGQAAIDVIKKSLEAVGERYGK